MKFKSSLKKFEIKNFRQNFEVFKRKMFILTLPSVSNFIKPLKKFKKIQKITFLFKSLKKIQITSLTDKKHRLKHNKPQSTLNSSQLDSQLLL